MEKFAEFGKAVLDFLVMILWFIYMFFSYVFTAIVGFFKNLSPSMPSTTRVLQERWLVITLLVIVVVLFLALNISAFNLFRKDKIMAQSFEPEEIERKQKYTRVSERRLLRRCFFCGAIGGFLAMKICRHKTLKPKFNIGVPAMALVQLLLLSIVAGYFIFWLCLA